jgi:23S rRNA (guanosine2251-2'-O)-methyltransferase
MSIIYGKNPVIEAITSGKTINKIYINRGSKDLYDIIKLAKENKIVIVESDKKKLDKMVDFKNSQGIVASVTDYEYFQVDDILKEAQDKNESPFVIILDKIEDPHNLGAIMRTVECLGAHGIIIQKRNACQVTDTVEKTSAGATSFVKVARVTNITETIKYLKEKGLWIYGLDMEGASNIYDTKFDGPIGIVIGNEGDGISRLVKENCDFMIKIPMVGKINSLNASVSAAISMYEIIRQKNKFN